MAALALAAAGCPGGDIPAETSLAVTFVRPTNGQLLLADADEDGTTAGYQTTIEVLATDSGGRAVTLGSAKLEMKLGNGPWTLVSSDPTLDGANARFIGVTLPEGPVQLQATVQETGSQRQAVASVTCVVQAARPRVGQCDCAGGHGQ
jgi:hypothetical protein